MKSNSQAAVNTQANAPAQNAAPQATQSRRILILDDEPEILNAYKDILTPKSNVTALKSSRSKSPAPAEATPGDIFEIVAVSDGNQAVAEVTKSLAEGKPFAMGFFDVLLGTGMDGIETVKRIHDLDPDIYAVLVTAYQDRHVDSIHKIFGEKFQDRWDYLNKPFTEGEIRQKARNMVSMWNIRKHEETQRAWLDQLKSHISENEKMLTVAAVARSVGHEFGNILLQIMGRADLSKSGKEPEMRKALETILVATEHASKVLERFKNLTKPTEAAKKFDKISLAAPIGETVALMEHELKRRRVKVVLELKDLPMVTASHSGLVQVFMNLMINAMHAMGENGHIEFKGSLVDQTIELRVHDSGPGIPEENMEAVFQPFFTTKGDNGTGLGLAICKEIIEITHGGKLTVSNHPQGGAEFLIVIPVHREGESV
jgi:signal transduction histidine kinase